MDRAVIAYSGSVYGTVAVHWLQCKRSCRVATFSANLGQGDYLEPIGEMALEAGADAAHVGDLRERFARDYIVPALKANAEAAVGRPLSSALSRPLIATEIVKIAVEDSLPYVGHAAKPMNSGQMQFQGSIASLAPHLGVLAPLREWPMTSREDVLAYAERYHVPIPESGPAAVSEDRNLWGRRAQCAALEDLWAPPPEEAFDLTQGPGDAPGQPREVVVGFDAGVPVSLDGEPLELVSLIEALNRIAGEHGVGRYDVVEDRMTGLRSRRLYEAPAATVLYTAHMALESIVLSRDLLLCKAELAKRFADLIYMGHWFSDLRRSLSAFVDQTQQDVTGDVNVRLFQGQCTALGRRSPHSMYDCERALPTADTMDGEAMGGYAKVMSMPLKTEAIRSRSRP